MKNTPDTTKAVSSAPSKREFIGTDNPRELRALAVLLRRPVSREQLDSIVGCSNGPDLIKRLRDSGLGADHLPCERIRFIDRDGCLCRPGVYSLTEKGRRMVHRWLAKREKTPNRIALLTVEGAPHG